MNLPTSSSTLPPRILAPSAGSLYRAFGDEVTIHLGGAETGGQFTLGTIHTPPGAGAPLHYHLREDECFLPLAGRVEFFVEGAWSEVAVDSVVFLPRGHVHAFRNVGQEPLRMLVQTSPAGFETFFARCAEEFARPGPPDMTRIVAISAEHGIHYPEQP